MLQTFYEKNQLFMTLLNFWSDSGPQAKGWFRPVSKGGDILVCSHVLQARMIDVPKPRGFHHILSDFVAEHDFTTKMRRKTKR